MKIIVHACRDVKMRQTLRDAASLFLKELLPYHVYSKLTVDIHIKPHIKDFGSCTPLLHTTGRAKHFEVELHPHKWKVRQLLRTLGHECTHIKQYSIGELHDISPSLTRWKSKKFKYWEVPYHKHPWEIEASGNEHLLWELWKDRNKP